jgi:alpha-mannosidase
MEMFAESQRLAKAHGIEIHTMFQGDVPGASWGLAAQAEQTGIRYFLSGPNASDRIGNLAKWQDKPFYWISPSGKEKLLFWQCQPYSIGYALKGSKIPNFFSVEDPKPFYTGKPNENFLNPYLFKYLGELEAQKFPYDMSILTWAMSDNAPIDPELPDAVKAWNEHFESPKLVITSVKDFFSDFEKKYKNQIPEYSGDYTEYWTDGVSSAARETAKNREASDRLKQGAAIWAINGKSNYPSRDFSDAWKNLLLFNEHTWGAYNSTDEPENPKVKYEWAYKQSFALRAEKKSDSLLNQSMLNSAKIPGMVDVYNTTNWPRTDVVYVPATLSKTGDLVKDINGKRIPSQRLTTGELAFIATDVPQMGKSVYSINKGKAFVANRASATLNSLENGVYTVELDNTTGDIKKLIKNKRNYVSDTAGLNHYTYLPGDSLQNMRGVSNVRISVKEKGPLVVSLLVTSDAAGSKDLKREVRLISGLDKVELINNIDKTAIRRKESVHFSFPFNINGPQVRYSIPWGSAAAEGDQLPYANHNWYTMQRWVDISNADFGVIWSSPDAPLFEIGKITTANLLGGLHFSPNWVTFTPQSPIIHSWVMNNLWHTNFRADQEGPTIFHYILQAHESGYNSMEANRTGLNNHQPLVVGPANGISRSQLDFSLNGDNVYIEMIKPSDDGKARILTIVNSSEQTSTVSIVPHQDARIKAWESNLSEEKISSLSPGFKVSGKAIMTIRIENK